MRSVFLIISSLLVISCAEIPLKNWPDSGKECTVTDRFEANAKNKYQANGLLAETYKGSQSNTIIYSDDIDNKEAFQRYSYIWENRVKVESKSGATLTSCGPGPPPRRVNHNAKPVELNYYTGLLLSCY